MVKTTIGKSETCCSCLLWSNFLLDFQSIEAPKKHVLSCAKRRSSKFKIRRDFSGSFYRRDNTTRKLFSTHSFVIIETLEFTRCPYGVFFFSFRLCTHLLSTTVEWVMSKKNEPLLINWVIFHNEKIWMDGHHGEEMEWHEKLEVVGSSNIKLMKVNMERQRRAVTVVVEIKKLMNNILCNELWAVWWYRMSLRLSWVIHSHRSNARNSYNFTQNIHLSTYSVL